MCVEVIVCYIIVVFLRHGVHAYMDLKRSSRWSPARVGVVTRSVGPRSSIDGRFFSIVYKVNEQMQRYTRNTVAVRN